MTVSDDSEDQLQELHCVTRVGQQLSHVTSSYSRRRADEVRVGRGAQFCSAQRSDKTAIASR